MAMQQADIDTITLWCRESRLLEGEADARVECDVTGRHIDLVEVRRTGDGHWRRTPIARLRYTGASRLWSLQWRDSERTFHVYRNFPPVRDVSEILEFLEVDPDPLFWAEVPIVADPNFPASGSHH